MQLVSVWCNLKFHHDTSKHQLNVKGVKILHQQLMTLMLHFVMDWISWTLTFLKDELTSPNTLSKKMEKVTTSHLFECVWILLEFFHMCVCIRCWGCHMWFYSGHPSQADHLRPNTRPTLNIQQHSSHTQLIREKTSKRNAIICFCTVCNAA